MDHGTSLMSELDRVRAEVLHCNTGSEQAYCKPFCRCKNKRGGLTGSVLTN